MAQFWEPGAALCRPKTTKAYQKGALVLTATLFFLLTRPKQIGLLAFWFSRVGFPLLVDSPPRLVFCLQVLWASEFMCCLSKVQTRMDKCCLADLCPFRLLIDVVLRRGNQGCRDGKEGCGKSREGGGEGNREGRESAHGGEGGPIVRHGSPLFPSAGKATLTFDVLLNPNHKACN